MAGVVVDEAAVAMGSLRNPLCHTIREFYGTKSISFCGIVLSEPQCCDSDDNHCGRQSCPVCEDLADAHEMAATSGPGYPD